MKTSIIKLIIGLGFLTAGITSIILTGWAVSILWLWFIVPIGAVAITIPIGIGINLLFRVLAFTKMPDDAEDRSTEEKVKAVLVNIIVSLASVGIGWIVTLFM